MPSRKYGSDTSTQKNLAICSWLKYFVIPHTAAHLTVITSEPLWLLMEGEMLKESQCFCFHWQLLEAVI